MRELIKPHMIQIRHLRPYWEGLLTPVADTMNSLVINAVGASYDLNHGFQSKREPFWFNMAAKIICKSGIAKNKKVCVRSFNLADGVDILDPARIILPADIFFICFVPQPQSREQLAMYNRIKSKLRGSEVSPYALDPEIWRRRAEDMGARLIMTCCSRYKDGPGVEVSGKELAGGPYQPWKTFKIKDPDFPIYGKRKDMKPIIETLIHRNFHP